MTKDMVRQFLRDKRAESLFPHEHENPMTKDPNGYGEELADRHIQFVQKAVTEWAKEQNQQKVPNRSKGSEKPSSKERSGRT